MPKFGQCWMVWSLVVVALGCDETTLSGGTGVANRAAIGEFVTLVNEHRGTQGCGELTWDDNVATVAAAHSHDMVDRRFFDHANPDGRSPFDRLAAADIAFTLAGENLATGQIAAEQVLTDWLNSAGHRANIENCGYTHHGMGLRENKWTHLFFTPP